MNTANSNYQGELVAVFGGGGYIGSLLVRQLLQEGYRVRVFDNFLFGNDGLADIRDDNLEIIEGDICDTSAVSQSVADAETVILLSAIVGRRIENVKHDNIRDINLLASSVVLDAAIEHGASRFVFASTDSVYGAQPGIFYETATPEPVSLYSRLKLRMEERVINAKRRNFHPTALRVATCYGYSPRMRFDLVANSLIRDAVCHKEIKISSGDQSRALIHVEDVARAFLLCVKAHVNLISGEIFNVGSNDQNVQVNHLANIVKTIVPETAVRVVEGEADLVGYHLSCSKIEKILDFTPRWTIKGGMEQVRDLLVEGAFGDPYDDRYRNT